MMPNNMVLSTIPTIRSNNKKITMQPAVPDPGETTPHPEPFPAYAKQWMAQWRYAAQELPQIRDRELRELTDQRAMAAAIALEPVRPYPLRNRSGMVAMQQWFSKLRKAPTS